MKPPHQDPPSWDYCPPGLIQETARVPVQQNGWWVGTGLALIVISLFLWIQNEPSQQELSDNVEINCQIVQQEMLAFVKSEIDDCNVARKIGGHIYRCKACSCVYAKTVRSLKCSERPKKVILKPTRFTNAP